MQSGSRTGKTVTSLVYPAALRKQECSDTPSGYEYIADNGEQGNCCPWHDMVRMESTQVRTEIGSMRLKREEMIRKERLSVRQQDRR